MSIFSRNHKEPGFEVKLTLNDALFNISRELGIRYISDSMDCVDEQRTYNAIMEHLKNNKLKEN